MVSRALERLANRPRHPLRDLQQITHAWFAMSSCFRPSLPSTEPTLEGLALVARFADHPDDAIACSALAALRAAANRWSYFQRERAPPAPELVGWPGWGVARDIVAANLASTVPPLRRVVAARVVGLAPCAELPLRDLAANDVLYTVRWNAIRALALLGDLDQLAELLAACAPRGRTAPPERWATGDLLEDGIGYEFQRAAAACVAAGVVLIEPR